MVQFGDSCFSLSSTEGTFDTGTKQCSELPLWMVGRLAKVEDEEQVQFLASMAMEFG